MASSGDREMTSTRGPWIGYLLAGLSIAAAPIGFPAARAQGYSPDPYKPFNHQFEQYVYPTSPALTGQAGIGPFRRVDNQFQQWVTEQDGAERASKERYGIGVQHWKLRTDLKLDRLDRLNRKNGRRIDDSAAAISRKYLAYFSENDPTKRAVLMREFVPLARRDERENLARVNETETGANAASGRRAGRGASSDISRDATRTGEEATGEGTGRSVPPPPPISRFSGGSGRTPRKPTDVLDRSRSIPDYDRSGSRTPPAAGRGDGEKPPADSPER